MTRFRIEKNIPYTKENKARITKDELPLNRMTPGDSILLEPKADNKTVARWYSRIKYFKDRYAISGQFKLGKSKGGLRLWKLSDDMQAA